MLSFYQKLAGKINAEESAAPRDPAPAKGVTYNATGERTSAKQDAPAAAPVAEATPDGADSLDVDLFQSESRMVVFAQMSGVMVGDFDIVLDEESNTLLIQATQKRPEVPHAKDVKEGAPAEKGRFTKQEVKWKTLYRKVYLPAPFDGGEAKAMLEKGVLIITLPAKQPGTGKKLVVREIPNDEHPA